MSSDLGGLPKWCKREQGSRLSRPPTRNPEVVILIPKAGVDGPPNSWRMRLETRTVTEPATRGQVRPWTRAAEPRAGVDAGGCQTQKVCQRVRRWRRRGRVRAGAGNPPPPPPSPATSVTAVGLSRFPWLEAPSGEPWTPTSGVTEPSPRGKPEIDFEPLGHTCSVSAGAWGICLSPGRNLRGRGRPGVQTHASHQPRGHKPIWSKPGALLLLSFHFCLREEKGCRAAGAGVQKKPGGGV